MLRLLLLVLGSSCALAQSAPPGTWPCAGGGPERNHVSETPLITGPVHEAWRLEVDGTIVHEPILWDDRMLVVTKEKEDYEILVVSVRTGEVREEKKNGEIDPEPSMWGSRVLLRSKEDRLSAFSWNRSKLKVDWTLGVEEWVRYPLLCDDGMFAFTDQGLGRYKVGKRDPLWIQDVTVLGPLSIDGPNLLAVIRTVDGPALVEFNHHTGARGEFFHLTADKAPLDPWAPISVLPLQRGVRFTQPVTPAWLQPPVPKSRIVVHPHGMRTVPFAAAIHAGPFVPWNGGWVGEVDSEDGIMLLSVPEKGDDIPILGAHKSRPEYIGRDGDLVVSGDLALIAGACVNLKGGEILWDSGVEPIGRPIPARERVIYRVDDQTLVAVGPRTASGRVVALADEAEAFEGRAVLADRSILEASFKRVGDGVVVVEKKGDEPLAPEETLLVEDEDGKLYWSAGSAAWEQGIEVLANQALLDAVLDIGRRGKKTQSPVFLNQVVDSARAMGATEEDVESILKTVASLEKRPKKIKDALVEELTDELKYADDLLAGHTWERFENLPEEASLDLRLDHLERVLLQNPHHAEAHRQVRKLLPSHLPPSKDDDSLDWITFLRLTSKVELEFLEPPKEESSDLPAAEIALGRAATLWRPDLIGVRSKHLLVVTPWMRPGALARSLSHGELTCQVLEEMFADHAEHERSDLPLVIYLMESQEEYLSESKRHGVAGGGHLAWSAGHYDQKANLTRLFVPEDPELLESVNDTLVHEVTHHWLAARCPMWPLQPYKGFHPQRSGFWIVEGFPTFIESLAFDHVERSYEWNSPRNFDLDAVAWAEPKQLFDWGKLVRFSQAAFAHMKMEGNMRVPVRWMLGSEKIFSPAEMFYTQSSALVHYLWHGEDGKHRELVLRTLQAVYDKKPLPKILDELGMSAEELGLAVKAHAHGVVTGG